MEINKIVSTLVRYKNVKILETPTKFCDITEFKNKDIVVQVHDTTSIFDDANVVGFCGQFNWKNNHIISLDGDSYDHNMLVHGYEITPEYVDVLVENW